MDRNKPKVSNQPRRNHWILVSVKLNCRWLQSSTKSNIV